MPSKRMIVVFILLLVIGAAMSYLFVRWANAPVKQAVQIDDQSAVLPAEITYKPVTTKFYSTKIDSTFRFQTSENPSDANLLQASLHDSKGSGKQVGITTNRLPGGGLSAVADYNYRATTPSVYKPFDYAKLPSGDEAFRKADGEEISVFMTHNGRYASITASGTDVPSDQLIMLMDTIINNWHWVDD